MHTTVSCIGLLVQGLSLIVPVGATALSCRVQSLHPPGHAVMRDSDKINALC